MIVFAAILAIQILCIIDVIRNGRNQLWIMALMFLPMASAVAYLVIEVAPRFGAHRHVRSARASVVATLDPEREVRAARDALELADTVANQTRLADALAALGRYGDALPLYRAAIARAPGDRLLGFRLATAEFETGDAAGALARRDALPRPGTQTDRDRHDLLRARLLDALARRDEAAALYADLVTRMPGEEARCRYAALLLEMGRLDAARAVLEEVEARMKRLDRHQRQPEAEMYRWAGERLRELRG